MNPIQDNNATNETAVPTILETVIANMYKHIAAYQESINNRAAGGQFPEIAEVNWLVKMVACADKLVKQNAPDQHHKSIKAFVKYAAGTDAQLGKTMKAVYRDYVSEFGAGPTDPLAASPASSPALALFPAPQNAPAPFPVSSPAPAPFPAPEVAPFPALEVAPFPVLPSAPEDVPLTEADFERYKHLLDRVKLAFYKDSTVEINGTPRNIKWVQFNLLQYCKPAVYRRFYPNEATFHQDYDHHNVSMEIDRYISQGMIRLNRD